MIVCIAWQVYCTAWGAMVHVYCSQRNRCGSASWCNNVSCNHCSDLSVTIVIYCRGTEKQHVAYDYATRLHIGQVECEVSGCGYSDITWSYYTMKRLIGRAMGEMSVKSGAAPLLLTSCEYLNISVCPSTTAANSVCYITWCCLCVLLWWCSLMS